VTATRVRTAKEGQRPRRVRGLPFLGPLSLLACLAVLAVLVLLPLGMLVFASFRTEPPGLPSGLSAVNYREILSSAYARDLVNSLLVAVGSAVIAMAIGGVLAVIMARVDVPLRRLFGVLVLAPAYISSFIGAIAWSVLLSPKSGYLNLLATDLHLPTVNIYSIAGICWVLGTYLAPMSYLYILPALARFDRSLEEAGRATGATMLQTVRYLLLPLLRPAMLSAALIVFVEAIGDFAVPAVLGERVGIQVVPTEIVEMTTQYPSNPNGAAVFGVLLVAFTLGILAINNFLVRRHSYVTVTLRGSASARPSRTRIWRSVGTVILCLYALVAVILPLGVIVLGSFQPYLTTNFTGVGLTLGNYRYVFSYPQIQQAILHSIEFAAETGAITSVLAVLLGYVVTRGRMRGRQLIDYVAMAPLAIPHTVFGLAVLWTWILAPVGVYGTNWIMLIAYVALFLPYSMRASISAFGQIDPGLEEAARLTGATWWATIRKIVVPLLAPALVSSLSVVLYSTVRELSASLLLYTPANQVMSISIWSMLAEGQYVQVFALAVIQLILVSVLIVLAGYLGRRLQLASGGERQHAGY
jgi:iron(III) transport system permease protein